MRMWVFRLLWPWLDRAEEWAKGQRWGRTVDAVLAARRWLIAFGYGPGQPPGS